MSAIPEAPWEVVAAHNFPGACTVVREVVLEAAAGLKGAQDVRCTVVVALAQLPSTVYGSLDRHASPLVPPAKPAGHCGFRHRDARWDRRESPHNVPVHLSQLAHLSRDNMVEEKLLNALPAIF